MRSRFCFPHQAVFRRLTYGLMGLLALSASRTGLAAPVFMGLGDLPDAAFDSLAAGISGDGSTIVGQGRSASGYESIRWTLGTGMVGLGDLFGGGFESIATRASADGSVVVGQGRSSQGIEAFRWTAGGGMVGLGDLP
ncbi:MAG: hypothetical protein L6R00_21355 [Phycisphaerae bacterium]|nr:hypothetical protein [Phycisphaerae bacterium]